MSFKSSITKECHTVHGLNCIYTKKKHVSFYFQVENSKQVEKTVLLFKKHLLAVKKSFEAKLT